MVEGAASIAHLGYVGTAGNVKTKPFENTWLAPPESIDKLRSTKVIAVSSFSLGNDSLSVALTKAMSELTTAKVLSPYKFAEQAGTGVPINGTEEDVVEFVKNAGKKAKADIVLITEIKMDGSIGSEWSVPFYGGKTQEPHRLTIRAITVKDGIVLWKDELPYVVLIGGTLPSQEEVVAALIPKIIERIKEKLPLPYKNAGEPATEKPTEQKLTEPGVVVPAPSPAAELKSADKPAENTGTEIKREAPKKPSRKAVPKK